MDDTTKCRTCGCSLSTEDIFNGYEHCSEECFQADPDIEEIEAEVEEA